MRYAVSIPPFTDVTTVLALATEAEAAGWDGVFLWDHLQWSRPVEPHDPWVLLGAAAVQTERVLLGTLVTPLSRRRPWVVAKQMVTLDHLSNGRAVLGVGLGSPVDKDFTDLGDEGDARVRAEMLDESLDLIDRLWTGPTDFAGGHFTVQADFLPRPVQQPRPPVWVAGVMPNRRPLQRARRWDGIVPIGKGETALPAELADYLGRLEQPAPADWDVVAHWVEGVPAQEYADAGATWLVLSANPKTDPDWVGSIRSRLTSLR